VRLKTDIWVKAYLRQCEVQGLYGAVVHKGAPEAGAVYITVNRLDGTGLLLVPAPGPAYDDEGQRRFVLQNDLPQSTAEIGEIMVRRRRNDPDIWLIEIEDRKGLALISPVTE
jgi:hypothetical protein